ncbi:MAG: hypothetical protein AAB944_01915 [Patescibacteria group bacterium]
MDSSSDKGEIDKLKSGLYSRTFTPQSPNERSQIQPGKNDAVEDDWKPKETFDILLKDMTPRKPLSWIKIIFIAAFIFFLLSVATAVYMFYGGSVVVSSKNVDISVIGPISMPGGEELVLDIVVHNKNNVSLESANLLVEYPLGTRVPGDLETELLRDRQDLGVISAGGIMKKTIKTVLFGEKESVKQIKISLEYRVTGSNATFGKELLYDVTINSAPVTLTVEYPVEVNANQQFQMIITAVSNSSQIIRNLLVKVEYPFGFHFDESEPKTISESNTWRLGDLEPTSQRKIIIKGRIEGQAEEERTFRFNMGVASSKNEKIIGINFLSLPKSILIKKPPVDLSLNINFDSGPEYITSVGSRIHMSIEWFNTLPVNVLNGSVEVKLSGKAFDRTSVIAQNGGFYRSIDNTVMWDKNSNPVLSDIPARKTGAVNVDFGILREPKDVISLRNPEVFAEVTLKGTRFSPEGAPEEVVSTATKRIKILSDLNATGRLVYSTGPFTNKGPIPPKAEVETTYTAIWTVTNSFNSVSNATLYTTLPPYVSWLDRVEPSTERVSFDPGTRQLVWNLDQVAAGTGISRAARQVSFQLSFLPSLGQVNLSPIIVNAAKVGGKDDFTGTTVEMTQLPLTTRLLTDPAMGAWHDQVVK